MCGISGIVNGNIVPLILGQDHRGPDGDGNWYNQEVTVSLGHNRLKIIDLTEYGRQPMYNDRYALTYNGEIYNYKDFGLKGNDAAVLLQLIEEKGLAATLSIINGMFAIGVYDNHLQQVHLVVDRFAQKPLYYYHRPETGLFAFASSPAALLHLQQKWSVSESALASYWKLGSTMECIWQDIHKVNASEWITFDIAPGSISKQKYWEPSYQPNTNVIEDLILDSIRLTKVSDVPIYTFLSGGVDSTLVASQFEGGNAIHLHGPEEIYASHVAKRFGLNLQVVSPAVSDPIADMKDYALKCAEPSMAALIPYITSREAAKFCKVAISANGADELFFGYDRTSKQVNEVQMNHIFRRCVASEVFVPEIDHRLSSGRWLELMTYIQFDLNKTLDFAAMAHSLEVRSPFLDHRLVEMALSMTPEQIGRKEILKAMLRGMGFSRSFTDRSKMGFSLYVQPTGLDKLQTEAYSWCVNEGWLGLISEPGKRDMMYLKASAFGFKQWVEVWENKIK